MTDSMTGTGRFGDQENVWRTAVLGVGALLTDRMLTVAGGDIASACAAHIDPAVGGLVITGDKTSVALTALAHAYPALPLFREPVSASRHCATADAPFDVCDAGQLFALSLDDILDGQRAGGAHAAMTPTGFMSAGAEAAMKSAVETANLLDRDDTILWLPCHYEWGREPGVSRFIAIAGRSRHPIAWSLAAGQDPLAYAGVAQGVRRAVAAVPGVTLWRTDLAGIDALAHGAACAAIGVLPSTRHLTEPGVGGRAGKPGQRTPHILLSDLLRFVRADRMRDDWFASSPAPTCACTICAGQALDRFDGTERSRLDGHLHNLIALSDLHAQLLQANGSRTRWWHDRLDDARVAHQTLAGAVGTMVAFPRVLDRWSNHWA